MATKRGTNLRDILFGTNGIDSLFGLGGNDDLFGRAGNDRLFGGDGNDKLFGEAGNDFLDGGRGADQMRGGIGNDTYVVDNPKDAVIELAGQGTDTVRSSITYILLDVDVEHLVLTGSANINGFLNSDLNEVGNSVKGNSGNNFLRGADGHDVLIGGLGSDILQGLFGNDTLIPGAGNAVADTINGGAGFDTVDYRDAQAAVLVFLLDPANNAGVGGAATGDTITLVENVVGSRFADSLIASTVEHAFAFGGAGDDSITGSDANYDRLRGDDGYDQLFGRLNSTEDFWLQYDRGMDFVNNFRQSGGGEDHIVIVKSEFGLSTPSNSFILDAEFEAKNNFGYTPIFEGSERLVYETTSRILWADKDGVSGTDFDPVPIAYFNPALGSGVPDITNIFVL